MTTGSESIDEAQDTVRVSRTVSHSLTNVWGALMAPHGAEALLGEGGALGGKGEPWRAADGTHGVARSFHPMEQIRFSWHPDDQGPASVVELDLADAGDGQTKLDIAHGHLGDDADRTALTQRWTTALDRIDAMSL